MPLHLQRPDARVLALIEKEGLTQVDANMDAEIIDGAEADPPAMLMRTASVSDANDTVLDDDDSSNDEDAPVDGDDTPPVLKRMMSMRSDVCTRVQTRNGRVVWECDDDTEEADRHEYGRGDIGGLMREPKKAAQYPRVQR